jgi:FAD binding domain/Berberine and berberine like
MASEKQLARLEAALDGDVVVPEAAAYDEVRKSPWAQYAHVRPLAVARCRTPADVAEAFAFARRERLPLAIRSGGHCFAGRSTTRGLVTDLSPIASVRGSGDVAHVGAGALLGDIDDTLVSQGRALVAGACPSVGVAGLTLGGGLGIIGRSFGLTCDRLLEAEVVLADGRVVTCDEERHADLFWALRGAGAGRFAVVTSFTFRTVAAQRLTCFQLAWPAAHAAGIIDAWQRFAPAAPDELAASLLLNASAAADEPARVSLFGAMRGGQSETRGLLDEFVARAGADPDTMTLHELRYREAKRYLAEHAPGVEGDITAASDVSTPPFVYAKSNFFRQRLPQSTLRALVEHFLAGRSAGQARELDFTPWGGAYNRLDASATAFPHRQELFLLKHAVIVPADAGDADRDRARRWLDRSWKLLRASAAGGVFPNFPDPDLAESARAYDGANYERLTRVKARYDPDNFFRFHK